MDLAVTNLMDDANVPSLLSLGYLNKDILKDKAYQDTRKFVLSKIILSSSKAKQPKVLVGRMWAWIISGQ